MTVTFQAQVDPDPEVILSEQTLEALQAEMFVFCSRLEKFKHYVRWEMCIDNEMYIPKS